MPTEGILTEGILTEGILTEGILTVGMPTEGILTEGILTEGILTEGILTVGMPTEGILTEGMPTEGILTEGLFVAVGRSNLGERNKFGYSTDGQVWSLVKETNGLFGGDLGSGRGVAYDGKGLFVAVGFSNLGERNKFGYSTDGKVWTLAKETNGLFGGDVGSGFDVAYGNGRFVAVGRSNLGERNKFGYSTDGKVWHLAKETNGLFDYNFYPDCGIAYGNGRFVAVTGDSLRNGHNIGYSTDGQVWTLATETNGLFYYANNQSSTFNITYGNGRFVAVGGSNEGDTHKIGYSTDGQVWTLAKETNGLFDSSLGAGGGVTYGNDRFVAVGFSLLSEKNKFGYSTDGQVWTLATNTNGLFGGDAGFGVAYGNGRFVAVGSSNLGGKNNIGYSKDGQVWTLATETNGLFGGDAGQGLGIAYAPPAPTPTPTPLPISNICFPAGTPIQTDQGPVMIEKINTQKHTINQQPIRHLTQTTTLEKYLIRFEKHSVNYNCPNQTTLMTKDHLIAFQGNMVPAYRFLACANGVKKVKYNGEPLYNVLLNEHGKMTVNNLVCETLHPDNVIAKLYNSNYSADKQHFLINQLNRSLTERDLPTYKKIINTLHTTF